RSDRTVPEAGVVFRRSRRHAPNISFTADAGLPPGSFFLDESARHDRVGGCGWEFAGILFWNVAGSAADPDGIASGHGAECRGVRRDIGRGTRGRAVAIPERAEAAVWN